MCLRTWLSAKKIVSAFPHLVRLSTCFLYLQFLPKVVNSNSDWRTGLIVFPLPSFQMLNCITNLESLGSGRENTHLNCFVVTIRLNGSHLLSSNHFFTLPIMTQSRLSRKLLIDIWRNIGSINFVVGHICGICEAEQEKTYFPISATYVNLYSKAFKAFWAFQNDCK